MFVIYNNKNKDKYQEMVVNSSIDSDIYFDHSFLEVDAFQHQGEYEIFFGRKGNSYFLYPYLKVPFIFKGETFFDLLSPYGYAGPICNDKQFFKMAELSFLSYIKGQGDIITEFIRYHYLHTVNNKFDVDIDNQINRNILILKLDKSWGDTFLEDFSGTARNLIRSTEKKGFQFIIDEDFNFYEDFMNLYYRNMEYSSASSYYYFPKSFFEKLRKNLKGKLMLAHLKKDGLIYCSSLFFLHSGIITYYLSGRNIDYPKIPSNYAILGGIVKWGIENKFKLINFGGGRTKDSSDKLLKFKSNFSKSAVPFYIGKRIHSPEIYDRIKKDYILKNGSEKYENNKHLLQFYR